jgi:hypothetical protein
MSRIASRGLTPHERVFRLSLWSAVFAAVAYTTTDPDLWGHLRFGIDILRCRCIERVDPYSFTSDTMWLNHEWASEASFALMYAIAGNAGLILLKCGIVAVTVWILQSTLRAGGITTAVVRDTLAVLAVIATMEQIRHIRPELWSLVCFSILLWCLVTSEKNRFVLVIVPLVFMAWANLHGGWVMGGGVFLVWTIGVATANPRDGLWYAGIGLVSLAATLINPYGFTLWQFLWETVGPSRPDIAEWQPVYVLGWQTSLRWAVILALALLGLRSAPIRRERIFAVALLAVMSFMVSRVGAFFGLAVVFLFGAALGTAWEHRLAHRLSARRRDGAKGPLIALTTVAVVALALAVWNLLHLRIDPRFTPEAEATSVLRRQPPGRLLTWFGWGEYAIWHLSPAMRVSMDGRRETVYSPAMQARHLTFYFDAPRGASLPDELAADYIWIPRTLPAATRLASTGRWHLIYQGEQSAIFARDARRDAERTAPITSITNRMFPGP